MVLRSHIFVKVAFCLSRSTVRTLLRSSSSYMLVLVAPIVPVVETAELTYVRLCPNDESVFGNPVVSTFP